MDETTCYEFNDSRNYVPKRDVLPNFRAFFPMLTPFRALGQHPGISWKKALTKIYPSWVSTLMKKFRKIEQPDFKTYRRTEPTLGHP